MDAYAAALFGGLLKIYDDMEDIPVITQYKTAELMEIIKALIIASFTYASIHNMNFPLIIFIANSIHCLMTDHKALATDFYHAGIMIAFLLMIITFDVSEWNILSCIIIPLLILTGYVDHTLFPEEYSWGKIIGRTLFSIGLIVSLQLSIMVPFYDIIAFSISYCITSILIMTYTQYTEATSKVPSLNDISLQV